MDQIKLEFTEIKSHEKSSLKEYDVAVIINNIPMKHQIFNGCEVVPASRFDFAEFDLFTCGCGCPGCAGFHTPVVQHKTDKSVKWIFPNDKSYLVDKLEYEFDRIKFEKEFESIRKEMLKLEKNNTHLLSCIRDLDSYVGSDEEGDERLEVRDELQESFKWYENRYQANENFNSLLKGKFPSLHQKSFKFKYEDKVGETNFDLNYLICRVLNQWPSKPKEKAYLKKVESVGDLIVNMLNGKDYQAFLKLVHQAYKSFIPHPEVKGNYKESVWSAFNSELYRLVSEESFDVNKLQIVISE